MRWRARATPHKLAVLFEGRRVSYTELERLSDRMAAGLVARGVQPGDRIAADLSNSVEAIAFIHAAARARAVLAPRNTRLTAGERNRQLALIEPALLVADEDANPPAAALAPGTPQRVSLAELGLHTPQIDGDDPALYRDSPASAAPQVQSILFTSGATGAPKGVALSFDNHFWSATASAYRLGSMADDRWLSCLPLYHVGGLAVVFRSCLYGAAIVLQRGFDLGAVQRSLREDAVTLVSLVPTMLFRLLHSCPGTVWPDSLRAVLLGGAAAAPELLRAAASVPVATTYGLTEASSQVATAPPADARRKPGSVGRPLMFTALRIVDPDGRPLRAERTGEITVRGPQVMVSYYGNADATAKALRDGWLHTGDLGYLDADGDLFVVQRRQDVIVSGGENIYPAEVEAVLRTHSAVADACVVGVPDAEWGQRCAAAVQLHAGETLSRQALLSFSRARLAGYKQPAAEHLLFVEALPQTASGKIARREVEALLADRGGARRAGIVAAPDADSCSDAAR